MVISYSYVSLPEGTPLKNLTSSVGMKFLKNKNSSSQAPSKYVFCVSFQQFSIVAYHWDFTTHIESLGFYHVLPP
jgi:hypothetical protein